MNGFGIFTASHVKEGTTISTFDGPSIPITDFEFYAHNPHGLEDDINQFRQVFQNYWWAIGMPDYAVYESSQVYDYTISFGSLPNHHCVLVRRRNVFIGCMLSTVMLESSHVACRPYIGVSGIRVCITNL